MRRLVFAAAAVLVGLSAAALAQPTLPTNPNIPPPGAGTLPGPGPNPAVLPPNLRIVSITPEGGTSTGRWAVLVVENAGRGFHTAEFTPIRARIASRRPASIGRGELLLLTCALPTGWSGGSAPCASPSVGRLAPGARVSLRVFLEAAPASVVGSYEVEVGVDICGPDWATAGVTFPACWVSESNERDNTTRITINNRTG